MHNSCTTAAQQLHLLNSTEDTVLNICIDALHPGLTPLGGV